MAIARGVRRMLPRQLRVAARALRRRRPPSGAPLPNEPPGDGVLRCRIAYNRYGGYCVPLSSQHRPAAKAILEGRVYEPDTITFVASRCGRGDIVHAGTYFGDFLPALAHAVADGALIWAFEPNEENFRCAGITLAINAIENTRLMHAALGEGTASGALVTADAAGLALGGGSTIARGTTEGATLQPVSIVAVDDVVPRDREVSLMQLDVEGYEREALAGAVRTIERWRPVLVLESLPDGGWLRNTLTPLGYTAFQKVHGNTVLACGPGTGVADQAGPSTRSV
jgi:FkbM family methyltransferase